MPTFGVKTDITMSTKTSRINYNSFYKSFEQNNIKMESPVTIVFTESETFDLSNSSFVIVVADDYGLENEVLNITFTDSDANEFTLENVGFLSLNFSNLVSMSILNSSDTNVSINIVY